MNAESLPRRALAANALFGLLNPIPFGFFVAALIFDIVYSRTGELLWGKGAAWLITLGLLFAVVPRVINFVRVWITSRRATLRAERLDFWVNLMAVAAALINAFVHSRDAYGVVPAGLWLSVCTVVLLSVGNIAVALDRTLPGSVGHA